MKFPGFSKVEISGFGYRSTTSFLSRTRGYALQDDDSSFSFLGSRKPQKTVTALVLFDQDTHMSKEQALSLTKRFPKLENLTILGREKLSSKSIVTILKRCPTLRYLLCQYDMPTKDLIETAKNHTNLQTLNRQPKEDAIRSMQVSLKMIDAVKQPMNPSL